MRNKPVKFWDRKVTLEKWNPFVGEAPASRRDMPPLLIPPIMAGLAAVGYAGTIAGVAVSAATLANVIAFAVTTGAMMGASLLASSSANSKTATSLRGGIQVNGHSAGDALRIVYGSARTGGTWGWWKTTSTGSNNMNNMLHVVIGWCEGECALDKDLEQPMFKGHGLNDLISKGPYTGATYNKYQIYIDGEGTPDTIKWRVDSGAWTTGVALTGGWQLLSNNVYIKAKKTTGHTLNDHWEMYGGDGIWAGDRLFYAYLSVSTPGGVLDFIEHHFHSGSFTQTVDTDLQGYVPEYENVDIWKSIPEFRAKLKKIDILDTRTSTAGYTNNAALIYYDFLTNQRYGRGLATAKAVTADIDAAANWCDPDYLTHGGVNYTCLGDHTSGASTEPGVGADWETFWAVGGPGGDAWAADTYYRMGYQFNGVILDRKEANEHLREIALNFLGFGFESGGKQRLKVYDDDAAVATFTQFENEVVIDPEAFKGEQPGLEESPNVVTCHFINPAKNWGWDTVSYPDDDSLATLPPSGNLVTLEIELIGTTNRRQAKQIAKWHYGRLNLQTRFPVLCSPKIFPYEPGDMLTLTHEFPGWSGKKLRIDSTVVQQEGLVPIVLLDEAATLYDLEVNLLDEEMGGNSTSDVADNVGPDMTNVVLTGTAKKGLNLLQWAYSTGYPEENMTDWIVYRNTANDSATATEIDRVKGKNSKEYKDVSVTSGVTYYYWLKGINTSGTLSAAFCTVAAVIPLSNPVPLPTQGDILFLLHADGPTPFETDFTGNPVDSLGTAPTTLAGGVIFRPGKFGKGVQLAEATTNKVLNPSAETTGNFSAGGGATVARTTDWFFIGANSFYMATAGDGQSINLTTAALANAIHYLTFWFVSGSFSEGNLKITFDNGENWLAPSLLATKGVWKLCGVQVPAAQANASTWFAIAQNGAGAGSVYIDAVQVEERVYPTPYLDGSLGSGHTWASTAHASASSRTAAVLAYNSNMINPNVGTFLCYWTPTATAQAAVARVFFDLRDGTHTTAMIFFWATSATDRIRVIVDSVTYTCDAFTITPGTPILLRLNYNFPNEILKVWANETLIGNFAPPAFVHSIGANWYLGSNYSGTQSGNGVFDEACWINRLLTDDEGMAIYQSNAPINEISSHLPDRLAPTPDPPEGMSTGTPTLQATGSDKYKVDLSWTACVDSSGSVVKYEVRWRESGLTDYHTVGAIKDTTVTLKGLESGKTYEWVVVAYDKDKNYTGPCAPQTIGPISATLATPDGMSSATGPDEATNNAYDTYVDFTWNRVAGVNYELRWKKSGGVYHTHKIEDPGSGATITYRKGALPANITILWNIRSVLGTHQSAWCEGQNKTTQNEPATAIADPASLSLTVKQGLFEFVIGIPADQTGIKGFEIYVATSGGGTKYVIAKAGKNQSRVSVKIGEIYTGTTGIDYNTAYYFWVRTISNLGNYSNYVASDPTNAQIEKNEGLVAFSTPWRMKGMAHYPISAGVDETKTHTVNAGKVGLLCGYSIDGAAAPWSTSLYLTVDGSDILYDWTYPAQKISPKATNGVFLKAADSFKIITPNQAGVSGSLIVKEFDADPNITIIAKVINGAGYTVTSGKILTVTFVKENPNPTGATNVIYMDGVEYYDIRVEPWILSDGVLHFHQGAVLTSDTDVLIIGYESKTIT